MVGAPDYPAEAARAQLAALEAREEALASDVRQSARWQQLQVIISTFIITKILMLIKIAEALASDVRRSAHWKAAVGRNLVVLV